MGVHSNMFSWQRGHGFLYDKINQPFTLGVERALNPHLRNALSCGAFLHNGWTGQAIQAVPGNADTRSGATEQLPARRRGFGIARGCMDPAFKGGTTVRGIGPTRTDQRDISRRGGVQ